MVKKLLPRLPNETVQQYVERYNRSGSGNIPDPSVLPSPTPGPTPIARPPSDRPVPLPGLGMEKRPPKFDGKKGLPALPSQTTGPGITPTSTQLSAPTQAGTTSLLAAPSEEQRSREQRILMLEKTLDLMAQDPTVPMAERTRLETEITQLKGGYKGLIPQSGKERPFEETEEFKRQREQQARGQLPGFPPMDAGGVTTTTGLATLPDDFTELSGLLTQTNSEVSRLQKELDILAGQDIQDPRTRRSIESQIQTLREKAARISSKMMLTEGGRGTAETEFERAKAERESQKGALPSVTEPPKTTIVTPEPDPFKPPPDDTFSRTDFTAGTHVPITLQDALATLELFDPNLEPYQVNAAGVVIGPDGLPLSDTKIGGAVRRYREAKRLAEAIRATEAQSRQAKELAAAGRENEIALLKEEAEAQLNALKEQGAQARLTQKEAAGFDIGRMGEASRLERERAKDAAKLEETRIQTETSERIRQLQAQAKEDTSIIKLKHTNEAELDKARNDFAVKYQSLQNQFQASQSELDRAIRHRELDEITRQNKEMERIRQEEAKLQQQQFTSTLLMSITSNPVLLFFAGQGGLLSQLGGQLGVDMTGLEGYVKSNLAKEQVFKALGLTGGRPGGLGGVTRARL